MVPVQTPALSGRHTSVDTAPSSRTASFSCRFLLVPLPSRTWRRLHRSQYGKPASRRSCPAAAQPGVASVTAATSAFTLSIVCSGTGGPTRRSCSAPAPRQQRRAAPEQSGGDRRRCGRRQEPVEDAHQHDRGRAGWRAHRGRLRRRASPRRAGRRAPSRTSPAGRWRPHRAPGPGCSPSACAAARRWSCPRGRVGSSADGTVATGSPIDAVASEFAGGLGTAGRVGTRRSGLRGSFRWSWRVLSSTDHSTCGSPTSAGQTHRHTRWRLAPGGGAQTPDTRRRSLPTA